MKILLISLQKDLETIGLKFLHYYLLGKGYQSHILYLPDLIPQNNNQLKEIREFVHKLNPGLIGISLMSIEYSLAKYLTQYLKSINKSIPIIWGGIHPTISPGNCLDYADYVCVGEGERTILDIARAISKNENEKNINNLCYLKNTHVKANSLYPLIKKLDEIPPIEHIPRNCFVLFNEYIQPLDKKVNRRCGRYLGKIYSTITSRGCPFSCTYCCNNFISHLYHTNKIRRRSICNVIEELERAVRDYPEIDYINFQDDCFLACNEEYLKEFCTIYKEKIRRAFVVRSIPIFITREKLIILKKAGLAWISVGLQSGSDRTNKYIYKRKSLSADFLKIAEWIYDLKIAAFYDIIVDNPFESEEDKLKTVETLIATPKPFYPKFFSLVFYHGTELYEKAILECPEYVEDYLDKQYRIVRKNPINNLIRNAAFLNKRFMSKILTIYKQSPKSIQFKVISTIVYLLVTFLLEPTTYFRVIKLSQRGSYLRAFKILPIYFKEGIDKYMNQFRSKRSLGNR